MLVHERQTRHPESPPVSVALSSTVENDLRTHLRLKILEHIDPTSLDTVGPDRARMEIAALVERIVADESLVINDNERRLLIRDIQDEMLGLGPLELLLADPGISAIVVNGCRPIHVERNGRSEETDIAFSDPRHLQHIVAKIIGRNGRRIDEQNPMAEAHLPDGSAVHAIIPPVAIDGPLLSIRRGAPPLQMKELVESHRSLSPDVALLLEGLVCAKVNILICGGRDSGKTTLLNVLAGYIPPAERIVTIESGSELHLGQPQVMRLETRAPDSSDRGEVGPRALLANALRLRPHRLVLGDLQGAESLDLLQAMSAGQPGSLAAIQADSPQEALERLTNMVATAGHELSPQAARRQIAAAQPVIVHLSRFGDGQRKLLSLQEVTGMRDGNIVCQEIFRFQATASSQNGAVQGYSCATGVWPRFAERLIERGMDLPDSLFDPGSRFG